MVGGRVREVFDTHSETGEGSDFETAKAKLTVYLKPPENKRYETYQFHHLHKRDEESLDTFHIRLRRASANVDLQTLIQKSSSRL